MTELSLNLLIGVVGGLVATLLGVSLRIFWINVVLPWYEERVYKDAHIEGLWDGAILYEDGEEAGYTLSLQRSGHKVSGFMAGKKSGKIFPLQGEFRNMILTYAYEAESPEAIDRGCFTLLVVNNGTRLEGGGSFYFPAEHCVKSATVAYSRMGGK